VGLKVTTSRSDAPELFTTFLHESFVDGAVGGVAAAGVALSIASVVAISGALAVGLSGMKAARADAVRRATTVGRALRKLIVDSQESG
jgi:hypothetical protein